jgi:hypothetical protein
MCRLTYSCPIMACCLCRRSRHNRSILIMTTMIPQNASRLVRVRLSRTRFLAQATTEIVQVAISSLITANASGASRTVSNEHDLLVLYSGYHRINMTCQWKHVSEALMCLIPSCIRRRSNFPIYCVVHALYTPKLLALTPFPSLLPPLPFRSYATIP